MANHLLETRIRVDPSSKNVNLEFSWANAGGLETHEMGSSSQPQPSNVPAQSGPAKEGDRTLAQVEEEKLPKPEEKKKAGGAKGEYTVDEVKQHNKEDDCWVIIDGEVLDVTK